jgi:hypothetical protein
VLAHRQAEGGQRVEHAAVGVGHRPALHLAEAVGEEGQRAPRGDARVELAQAAGGGIARVDEDLLPSAAWAALRRSKSSRRMKISPRTSSTGGASPVRRSGIWRTVRTLRVTSSPVLPSPRVAACTSTPSS